MDLFGSDDSDGENGEEMPRSAACGVLQFHNGTEDEMLRVVAADAARGGFGSSWSVIGGLASGSILGRRGASR